MIPLMINITKYFLIFVAIVGFIYSIQGFMGKDTIVLNPKYNRASKEEREKMDKKAYIKQSSIIFLFIGLVSLFNGFTYIFNLKIFYYLAIVCTVIGIIYFIVSSRNINDKQNKD